jgi:hypothetical protein
MEIPTRLINLLNSVSWNAKKIFGSWMGQERYKKAKYTEAELFDRITTSDQFAEFLTSHGYEQLD